MQQVAFVATERHRDLTKARDIIAQFRGRAHVTEQAHMLLVGATTDEFHVVCDAFDLLLDALKDMVGQHAHGLNEGQQVHGHGLSTNAYALQVLEKLGVVKLTGGVGRCIYGVWNEEKAQTADTAGQEAVPGDETRR